MAQHWNSIGWMPRVCWDVGLVASQRRRRWTSIQPALVQCRVRCANISQQIWFATIIHSTLLFNLISCPFLGNHWMHILSKYEALIWFCFNVGPALQAVYQHNIISGSMSHLYRTLIFFKCFIRQFNYSFNDSFSSHVFVHNNWLLYNLSLNHVNNSIFNWQILGETATFIPSSTMQSLRFDSRDAVIKAQIQNFEKEGAN